MSPHFFIPSFIKFIIHLLVQRNHCVHNIRNKVIFALEHPLHHYLFNLYFVWEHMLVPHAARLTIIYSSKGELFFYYFVITPYLTVSLSFIWYSAICDTSWASNGTSGYVIPIANGDTLNLEFLFIYWITTFMSLTIILFYIPRQCWVLMLGLRFVCYFVWWYSKIKAHAYNSSLSQVLSVNKESSM